MFLKKPGYPVILNIMRNVYNIKRYFKPIISGTTNGEKKAKKRVDIEHQLIGVLYYGKK